MKKSVYYEEYRTLKKKYLKIKHQYGGSNNLKIISSDFNNNSMMDAKLTKTIAPNIEWSGVPEGTNNLLLLCYDPDAHKTWIHWLVYNIDPKTNKLIKNHYENGFNSFNNLGYGGPQPPAGTLHHYHFALYALNKKIIFENILYKYNEIKDLIKNNIIRETEIVGLYKKI
jgi:Raf kinase inhibitor-like YbhB/YbcL family protein